MVNIKKKEDKILSRRKYKVMNIIYDMILVKSEQKILFNIFIHVCIGLVNDKTFLVDNVVIMYISSNYHTKKKPKTNEKYFIR